MENADNRNIRKKQLFLKIRPLLFIITIILSGVFIWIGINRGEVSIVFNKAIRICMECIGLG